MGKAHTYTPGHLHSFGSPVLLTSLLLSLLLSLPIPVQQQNAAIFLNREKESIHVESFELSPHNEAVMTIIGFLSKYNPRFRA
jgi:hypothetical protein